MYINLRDMKVGDWGRVAGYRKSFLPYRKKLLSMGLTPGTEFKLVRIAPLGDPVEIRVRGTDLSLRRDEVAGLKIERLESEAPSPKPGSQQKAEYTIAVIGNPNCGKTTLFNGLTGARQHVGNWAGVTVEQKTGFYRYDNKAIKVVDLPGIYSLDVNATETSLDEKIARDYILSQQADLIINIVDTSHLEHNLYLTTQLLEMRLPILVVLNNMDDATGRGIKIDTVVLNRFLAIPIFFGVMYLMFTFTIKLGRVFKPFFNDLAQALFVDGMANFLALLGSPQWLILLMAQGVGNGIREVVAFIPILGFLYLEGGILADDDGNPQLSCPETEKCAD